MASISSTGIGSGLPVDSLVTQLMAVERLPVTALNKKEASFQAKLSAFGTMKSSLAALQTAAKALSTPAQLAPVKASVATSGVMDVSTGTGAVAGTYNVEVKSLAESQKLMASTGYADTTAVVGTGDLTFEFGTYGAAGFDATPGSTAKTITIDSAHQTLAGVRDAINAAHAGVSASIINDGSKNYLSLTSTSTGAANAMRVSAVGDPNAPTALGDLQGLAYDGSAGSTGMKQNVAAKDAEIFVDSVQIFKPSNTISDAIEGVTLNLTNTTAPGVSTKLSLTRDTASVQTAVQNFVKAYNDASKSMSDLTAYDSATGTGAILNGDSTVRSIQSQLRGILSNAIAGAAPGSATLPDIGITSQRDGSLAIDAAKLSSALSDPTKNLTALFAANGQNKGYGQLMDVAIGRILSPVGLLPAHTNSINTSIRDLGKQRDTINARLMGVEKRYRAQFSALDAAMASMTSTSTFLTQQLASLAKSTA
jgi:flagellar hook-associated protein 2